MMYSMHVQVTLNGAAGVLDNYASNLLIVKCSTLKCDENEKNNF